MSNLSLAELFWRIEHNKYLYNTGLFNYADIDQYMNDGWFKWEYDGFSWAEYPYDEEFPIWFNYNHLESKHSNRIQALTKFFMECLKQEYKSRFLMEMQEREIISGL